MKPLRTVFTFLFDLITLKRKTAIIVDELTLKELADTADKDGTLSYKDTRVRALVWELKYYKNLKAASLAGEYISEELLAVAHESMSKPLLIPVPMHKQRRKERGYNQTELLCRAALPYLGDAYEYAPEILERVVNTKMQQGLPKHIRVKNVVGSMQVKDPARVAGRVCVVVDDVFTTGATSEEARRCLRASGAGEIYLISLARP